MPDEGQAEARVEQCRTCSFWRLGPTIGGGVGWGQCRRMPPALPEARDDKLAHVGVWPHTEGRDWCGEWRPGDGYGQPAQPR